ncbi:MAG: esterase/lipase family protein [Bradymonadia bacterium]
MLALLSGAAHAQFNIDLGINPIGPFNNCGDDWISYDREAASPGEYFSVSPEKCNLVPSTGVRWTIDPPLPSGLWIHSRSGRVYGTPPANSADHQVRYTDRLGYTRTAYPFSPRTVTATWTGPTGHPVSKTTIFKYDFVDPSPLRTSSYGAIRFREGDGVQRRAAQVFGGTQPYRFQLQGSLPAGYRLESDGDLVGMPDNPHADCVNGCREYVQVTDAKGRTAQLFALVTNMEKYSDVDRVCYVLVHGHGPHKGNRADQLAKARAYWSENKIGSFDPDPDDGSSSAGALRPDARSFVSTLTADGDKVFYVGYDSYQHLRQSAIDVAGQLEWAIQSTHSSPSPTYQSVIGGDGCRGTDEIIVIGHSMGGLVMDYILGNADVSRRNHHPSFWTTAYSVEQVVTIQTPHRGSELADAKCDFEWSDLVQPLVLATYIFGGECDDGSWDLQTSEEVRRHIGPLASPTWAIGSHQGMCQNTDTAQRLCRGFADSFGPFNPARYAIREMCPLIGDLMCSNLFFDEQNDGAVEYTSAFACTGENPNDTEGEGFGDSSTDVCGNNQKVITGVFNFDVSEENHDTGRNAQHPDARRSMWIRDSIWSALPREFVPGTSRMSSAEAIHRVFGDGAWLHLDDR